MSLPPLPSPTITQTSPSDIRSYTVIPLVLRSQVEIDIKGDWFGLLSYESDLNIDNVLVSFNNNYSWLPLSAIGAGVNTPFEKIFIQTTTEVGKSLSLLIGGQAKFSLASQGVTISRDLVGLAREATLDTISTNVAITATNSNNLTNLPSMANALNNIEANATSMNAVITTNINYPLNQIRWGQPVEPNWVYGTVTTGPTAGAVLVSQGVSSGYNGYIWGYFLSTNDSAGNTFLVEWTYNNTTYQQMVVFGGAGTVNFITNKAVNSGLPAQGGSTMTISILNAGSTNALYMAGLLWGQV